MLEIWHRGLLGGVLMLQQVATWLRLWLRVVALRARQGLGLFGGEAFDGLFGVDDCEEVVADVCCLYFLAQFPV